MKKKALEENPLLALCYISLSWWITWCKRFINCHLSAMTRVRLFLTKDCAYLVNMHVPRALSVRTNRHHLFPLPMATLFDQYVNIFTNDHASIMKSHSGIVGPFLPWAAAIVTSSRRDFHGVYSTNNGRCIAWRRELISEWNISSSVGRN